MDGILLPLPTFSSNGGGTLSVEALLRGCAGSQRMKRTASGAVMQKPSPTRAQGDRLKHADMERGGAKSETGNGNIEDAASRDYFR
eukprot:4564827-Prymnesium_polylepis.1